MENLPDPVVSFFQAYERNIVAGDTPALLAQFADPFLFAGPQGTKIVSATDHAKALPGRRELFQRHGHQSSSLADFHPIPLSSRYVLVLTKWRMTFAGAASQPREIVVDSAFIVDAGAETQKIIVYLASEDIVEMLKNFEIAAA
ncbi:MAG: hypothetical protein ABSB50_01485 [Terracidiphilus sp.]|jgi:hypothetical protein